MSAVVDVMRVYPFFALLFVLCLISSSLARAESGWKLLLDRDLSQFDRYLSFKHQHGYDGKAPVDGQGREIAPLGYNNDPAGVFTASDADGEVVLRVSGEYYGCLITKREYRNYRLQAKVRWGQMKWSPRERLLRDGGILYHSKGPAGIDYWRSWILSQEFQIMEGHMGDYWNIGPAVVDIRALQPEGIMNPVASHAQPFITIGHEAKNGGFCLRSEDHEAPYGEWTQLELICHEGRSLHIVDGHVVMVLRNSRQLIDGKEVPLVDGKMQIQSEAGEVYFKDMRIQEIDTLPAEYETLFRE